MIPRRRPAGSSLQAVPAGEQAAPRFDRLACHGQTGLRRHSAGAPVASSSRDQSSAWNGRRGSNMVPFAARWLHHQDIDPGLLVTWWHGSFADLREFGQLDISRFWAASPRFTGVSLRAALRTRTFPWSPMFGVMPVESAPVSQPISIELPDL